MKNKLIFLGIVLMFLFLAITEVSALTVTLSNPENNSNITENSDVNFSCLIDAESGLNKFEILSNYDGESGLLVLHTFNKGEFNEQTTGNNYSVNYLGGMNVTLNPTYIVDGDGKTCNAIYDPCNLFNTTGGSVWGGYWRPGSLATTYFTITFNDTFSINKFQLSQHATFYSNHSKLEYSLDGNTWSLLFNKTTTATIDESFSPVIAKYLKWTSDGFKSTSGVYVYYVNVTGQLLNTSTPFNSSLNYSYSGLGGGNYIWNCKAYTGAENLTASSNFTFLMNGTRINWVNPTPSSGTESTYIKINTSITSNYDAYGFFNRDYSLIGWWAFDDSSNRLQSVNNVWGGAFTGSGTPTYSAARFQEGVLLGSGDSIYADNILTGNNDVGFTLIWSMNSSNSSAWDATSDWIYNTDYTPVGGFKLRFQSENETHWRIYILMYNLTGYSNVAPKLIFPKSYTTDFKRYALSVDIANQEYNLYVDGILISTVTSSASYNFYDHGEDLTFLGSSNYEILIDDIMFFNVSVTDEEGKLLSNYSKVNYFEMDYSSDKNITMKPYGYDNQGILATSDTRTFKFLISSVIEYTHLFNDNNETLWGYCRAVLDNVSTEDLEHVIQYSLDNTTWINLTETYQENNETYAVIGDSMSNAYEDWPGYLTDNFNITDTTIPLYSVTGNNCTQVYYQLINNVTNGTTNLFATCGVNSGIPASNTDLWEDIYNEAKIKNISKIYMTTMPPWDYINTLNNETAQTTCNLQKSQNQWLINFAANKSDLEVVDVWTFYHDTSGTNLTDCGWRTDITYSNDGTHPNSLGMNYWADEYWKLFNEWSNNTFEVSLTPNQSSTYYFRCYTEGNRQSLISSMGELYVGIDTCTYASGNWNINCADNCNVSSNVDLGGNNFTIVGTGRITITANITNFKRGMTSGQCEIIAAEGGGIKIY